MTNTAPSPLPYLFSLTHLLERVDPPYSVFVTQDPSSSSILYSITIVSLTTYCCLPCCALATGTKENNVFYFFCISYPQILKTILETTENSIPGIFLWVLHKLCIMFAVEELVSMTVVQ